MKTQVFRILCLGDVVGESSTLFLKRNLSGFRKKNQVDLCIVNGENSARRGGIDPESAEMLFSAGVDLITTGNHVFRQRNVYDLLDGAESLLRPCNYPGTCPGKGYSILSISGLKILVINAMGTLFMEPLSSPFEAVEKILELEKGKYDLAVCDFHGEATSEKRAFGFHFDSRIHIIFGTHTHVPTADLSVLPKGSAYITDLGMCGAIDSVLGMKKEVAIGKFLNHMPSYYEIGTGEIEAQGALFTLNPLTKEILALEAVRIREN